MPVSSPRGGDPAPGTSADVFVGWVLDRVGRRLDGPVERSTMEELAVAWGRVRGKPGRLSAKTRDEWSRIDAFMGVSGFGWFLLTAVIGVLFLIVPGTGWAALLAASLTTGLAVTRLAVHYAAAAAISHAYASSRRIRTAALLLRTRAVLVVALVAATVLYLSFGR
ncbi:hypothetical protein [Streptomyces stackebrandtii]|uniref:hypothetical protein n=1 Tax=Streptomyces stackebrandtii TaxID=3051177 RepID=UPI0028DBCA56|nr:hypothetical protein [Streptomyces sp. DSM 40976]